MIRGRSAQRARRLEHTLPGFLRDFEPIWGRMREELSQGWDYFRGVDLSALSLAELRENLIQARRYQKRAAEIHFQVMYPLLANYTGFYGMCTELGLDPGQIGRFLQGYDTKIMETDRELWRLAAAARAAGLEPVFAAHEADGIRAALAAHGGSAGAWLTRLDDFLQVYGWRTEGPADIALPSWIEDPTPALGMIKTFLEKDTDHDFAAARGAAVEERETAVDAARSVLTLEEQRLFDGSLASCRAANFPVVARRPQTLYRPAGHAPDAVGVPRHRRPGLGSATRTTRCTCSGRRSWTCRPAPGATMPGCAAWWRSGRNQYFDYWLRRRPSLPKVVGTVPESVNDPILMEIFGLNSHFLRAVEAAESDSTVKTLSRGASLEGRRAGDRAGLARPRRAAPAQPGRGAGVRVPPRRTGPRLSPRSPPAYVTAAAPCRARPSSGASTGSPR